MVNFETRLNPCGNEKGLRGDLKGARLCCVEWCGIKIIGRWGRFCQRCSAAVHWSEFFYQNCHVAVAFIRRRYEAIIGKTKKNE